MLAHPDGSAVLCAGVAGSLVYGLLLAHIPDANLLVAGGRSEQVAGGVPGQALDNVAVLEGQVRLAGANVPQLDRVVARGGGEDVFGRRVEEDLSDFSAFRSPH